MNAAGVRLRELRRNSRQDRNFDDMRAALIHPMAFSGCLPNIAHAQSEAPLLDEDVAGNDTTFAIGRKVAAITVEPRGLSASLGKDEFEAVNAVNVEDLMKYTPNFFVRKHFAGDDNSVVAMRSANTIQSARTMVMVGCSAIPACL